MNKKEIVKKRKKQVRIKNKMKGRRQVFSVRPFMFKEIMMPRGENENSVFV